MAPAGTLTPLIGVIAENAANGKRILQARVAGTGTLDRNIKFLGSAWHYLDVTVNPDANGDGIFDDPLWLVLAVRLSDQVIRVQSRFVGDGAFDTNIVILNTNWKGLRLDMAPDISGNMAPELVIVAVRRANSIRRIHIKDFETRDTTINIAPPSLPPPPTSNEPVNFRFILEAPLNVGPVFICGTFTNCDNSSEFELTDSDGDGEWSVIASIEQEQHDFSYVQGFREFIKDPNLVEFDSGDPQQSRIIVADPMIAYLLPLDGGTGLRPGEPIRAIFGFSDRYPIDPTSIEILINGAAITDAPAHYNPNGQEVSYTPPELLEPGTYTVQISAASAAGTVSKTTTFDRAPALELLTQDITYRKSDIVAYGLVNDFGTTEITAMFNGSPANIHFVENQFRAPVSLVNGNNFFEISGTDRFGNEFASSQMLNADFDLRPTGEIQGSVTGSNVTLTAVGAAFDGSAVSFEWSADSSNPEAIQFTEFVGNQTSFPIPLLDGEYFVNLRISDSFQNQYTARRFLVVEQGIARLNEINDHAAWVEDMVLYELMPELVSEARDLKGAQARLPDIEDLGVNTIWLTPVFDTSLQCTLGYGTTDFYDVCDVKGNTH